MFTIENGEAKMSELYNSAEARKNIAIPTSLKSLLVRRIDRLLPKEVLICKLASVLGQQFQRVS